MTTYSTSRGDTWDMIAYKQMGDCKYTNLLIKANQGYLPLLVFQAGVTLTIPDKPAPSTKDTYMPVWKQRAI